MELPRHASRPAPQGAAGTFSLVVGWFTLPASAGEPEKPSGGDAELARSPFGAVRPKASLSRCESWRGRGCAPVFMAAIVRRKQISSHFELGIASCRERVGQIGEIPVVS